MARPKTITDQQRAQVLELKRQHSYSEVAAITGLPLGTVRTIVRRSGALSDNQQHRQLFTLPPLVHSASRQLATTTMPPQCEVTGDKEIDAVLWLREVIKSGDPLAVDMALKAATNIKTPLIDIEKRYTRYLIERSNGDVFKTFASFNFADLKGLAESSITKELRKAEALARFGNDPDLMTEAERWTVRVMGGIDVDLMNSDRALVAERFKQYPELMPQTLADCLHELNFWNELYLLKMAVNTDEPALECCEREYFVFELMAQIRPRSRKEAKAVLQFMIEHERKDHTSANAILFNLVG